MGKQNTYPNELIFGSSSEELPIWTEAYTSNVKVSGLVRRFIGKDTVVLKEVGRPNVNFD